MKKPFALLSLFAALLLLAACENPERTADQVKKDIEAFRAKPGAETQAVVEKDFARLDEQVDALEKKSAAAPNDKKLSQRLQALEAKRSDLSIDFKAARMGKLVNDITSTVKDIGNSFKNFGNSVEKQIKSPDTNSSGN